MSLGKFYASVTNRHTNTRARTRFGQCGYGTKGKVWTMWVWHQGQGLDEPVHASSCPTIYTVPCHAVCATCTTAGTGNRLQSSWRRCPTQQDFNSSPTCASPLRRAIDLSAYTRLMCTTQCAPAIVCPMLFNDRACWPVGLLALLRFTHSQLASTPSKSKQQFNSVSFLKCLRFAVLTLKVCSLAERFGLWCVYEPRAATYHPEGRKDLLIIRTTKMVLYLRSRLAYAKMVLYLRSRLAYAKMVLYLRSRLAYAKSH